MHRRPPSKKSSNQRTDSLDTVDTQLELWEKAGSTGWQPVQVQLMSMLVEHVIDRHLAIIDPARWE